MNQDKQKFANNLTSLLRQKGWNKSELARRAGIGRDNISGYTRAINLPNSPHLNKLAAALSVEPSTLLGSAAYQERFPAAEETILRMEQVAGEPHKVRLQIQQHVTIEQAQKILLILQPKKWQLND